MQSMSTTLDLLALWGHGHHDWGMLTCEGSVFIVLKFRLPSNYQTNNLGYLGIKWNVDLIHTASQTLRLIYCTASHTVYTLHMSLRFTLTFCIIIIPLNELFIMSIKSCLGMRKRDRTVVCLHGCVCVCVCLSVYRLLQSVAQINEVQVRVEPCMHWYGGGGGKFFFVASGFSLR